MERLVALREKVRAALLSASVDTAVMGLDISFNESNEGHFSSHWLLHFRVHVPLKISKRAKLRMRPFFPMEESIYRPLRVSSFDGRNRGIAYTFKPNFLRRQSYILPSDKPGTRNTRQRPMRGAETVELALFLDSLGFGGRLELLGVRPIASPNGLRFVRWLRKANPLKQRVVGAHPARRALRHTGSV